jgi:uncharacterized protein DUF2630
MSPTDPDQPVEDGIEALIAREHELRQHAEGRALTDAEAQELSVAHVRLDELWDLLRQRRALREAGLDPADASIRDPETVENYEQ